ncbi:MAG: sulfotransferase [bacterium]
MPKKTGWAIERKCKNVYNYLRTVSKHNKTKIFCVGRNKTGTTSLKVAMENLGFVTGNQRTAELLFDDWAKGEFKRIIKYCHTAQFFQDVPFSLPDTFKILDISFPNSKFILTVRDSPEQWYTSITRFHAKIMGENGRLPTREDLQQANYIYKGRPWHTFKHIYNTPDNNLYNKEILINHYVSHNQAVLDYFKTRPFDLLVLNIARKGAYKKLLEFLNVESVSANFPWVNRTDDIRNGYETSM